MDCNISLPCWNVHLFFFELSMAVWFVYEHDIIVLFVGAEILILGCGRNIIPVDPELRRFIRSTGMKLESVDSVLILHVVVLLH